MSNQKVEEYWIGPYGVRVSKNIDSIVASDGGNILYSDGRETEMGWMNPLSKEEYLEKYTELKQDGHYYYV